MRRKFLASTALTTSTAIMGGAAWAADLPVKAPPVRAPAAYSWNGCYGGVNAGGGWVSIDQSVTTAAPFLPIRTFESSGRETSFIGGGQLGCNWQFDPSWVVGLEGDINYLHGSRGQSFRIPWRGHCPANTLTLARHGARTIRICLGTVVSLCDRRVGAR